MPGWSPLRTRAAFTLLLLLLVPAAQGALDAGDAFAPPPFEVGTRVSYAISSAGGSGWSNFTVLGPSTTLAVTGEPVEVFAVNRSWGDPQRWTEQRVSLSTLTVENEWSSCAVSFRQPDGSWACSPFTSTTWAQGAPALMGATVLQGRSFRVGDAWTQEGTCVVCSVPVGVAIEPPVASSPPDTAYTVNLSGWSTSTYTLMRGRLHMAADSPYPLLAELRNPWVRLTARLAEVVPGDGGPLPIASPPVPAAHAPPLASLPYQNGRPVEGAPLEGHLSWADARAATGPDPGDEVPGAALLGVSYPASRGWSFLGVTNPLHPTVPSPYRVVAFESETVGLRAEYALPNGSLVKTTYEHERQRSTFLDGPNPLVADPEPSWSASRSWEERPYPSGCPTSSAPLWDAVRASQATGLLGPFSGYRVDQRGYYGQADCLPSRNILYVTGDAHAVGAFGFYEQLVLDLETGYLRSGLLLPR